MEKIKPHQIQLLDRLSCALFGDGRNPETVTLEELKEAKQQAVLTLIEMPKDVAPEYYSLHTQILAKNMRVDCEHFELHRLLAARGIPYVILKGSVSASYYPEPLLRTMGDVDFLVKPKDLSKVEMILKENGFRPVEHNENECHIAFHRNLYGVETIWEMHWRPHGVPKGKMGSLIEKHLSDIIMEAEKHTVPEGEYMMPTAFHHGLIMLLHVAGHLINTGIGLRHLCDWAVFVARFSDEEFCDIFESKLKEVGLWRFAQLLTQLSIEYLHCPSREWCGTGDREYLENMMSDILDGGNFGIKDKNRINQAKLMTNTSKAKVDDTSLSKQFFVTMNEKARRGMPIIHRVPILLPIGWFYVGGRHLVRIAKGSRPTIDVSDMISGATRRKEIYMQFRLFETEDNQDDV